MFAVAGLLLEKAGVAFSWFEVNFVVRNVGLAIGRVADPAGFHGTEEVAEEEDICRAGERGTVTARLEGNGTGVTLGARTP